MVTQDITPPEEKDWVTLPPFPPPPIPTGKVLCWMLPLPFRPPKPPAQGTAAREAPSYRR